MYVQQMSYYIILTEHPLRIILIKYCLCKANPSLLREKKTTACWDIPQGGTVCGHVTSVATLKRTPLSSTSLGGLLKGKDTSREICLICTNGLFFVHVGVRSGGEGGIFFPSAYVTVFCICMFVQMNVRVCLRQLLTSFH